MDPMTNSEPEIKEVVEVYVDIQDESFSKEPLSPLEIPEEIPGPPVDGNTPITATPVVTPQLLVPSLKGVLAFDGKNHICKGVWAFSDDYHAIPGQTSEFEFRLIKPLPTCTRAFPMDGKYQGYFYVKPVAPLKTSQKFEDKDMNLVFTKQESGEYNITGDGSNKFGKFNIKGTLQENGSIQLYKLYELKPIPPVRKTPVVTIRKRPAVEAPVESPRVDGRIRKKASFGSGFEEDSTSVVAAATVTAPNAGSMAAFSPRPSPLEIPSAVTPRASEAGRTPRLSQHVVKCGEMLREIVKQPQCIWFLEPVDPVKLNIPDYPNVIKEPMDFGTIRTNLDKGVYAGPEAFAEHVRLVFRNALAYNIQPSNPVHIAAKELSSKFEDRYRSFVTNVGMFYDSTSAIPAGRKSFGKSGSSSKSSPRPRTSLGGSAGPRPADVYLPPALDSSAHYLREMQRRMEEMQHEIMALRTEVKQSELRKGAVELQSQALSFDEKTALIAEITRLPPNKMAEVIDIIKQVMPADGRDDSDEIEIPLDDLDTTTLRRLQRFVAQEAAAKKKRSSGGGSRGKQSAGDAKKRKVEPGRAPMSPSAANPSATLAHEEEVEAADLLFSAESFEDMRATAQDDFSDEE